jgi:CheY-like chemotaxis protein
VVLPATVLVVDDEPLVRSSAVGMVEAAGFAVIEANSADEAIDILEKRHDIQLVFTDIQMPGSMDGLKLARFIRKRWPPILLVLGSGAAAVDNDNLPDGARFFTKPYDQEQVGTTLRELLTA